MTDPERAEPARTRTLHIIQAGPVTWADVATRVAPMLARVDAAQAVTQVLVIVPSESDVTELTRELAGVTPEGVRVVPLAAPRRARRLLAGGAAHAVVTIPAVATGMLAASALSLGAVEAVVLGAADELEPDRDAIETILAEVPKGAAKVLACGAETPFVEQLATQHLHGARRIAAAPEAGGQSPAIAGVEVRIVGAGELTSAFADVLETIDAPSVAIVPADARRAEAVRGSLDALGYGASASVRVAPDGATGGAALVVFVGVPKAAAFAAVSATPPARAVALLTARERAAFAAVARGSAVTAFVPQREIADARAAEARLRDLIRRTAGEGIPAREMLALEPLLAEFDALVLAGAALRMYERAVNGLNAMKAAQSSRPAAPAPFKREGPPRDGPPRERPMRDGPPRERPMRDGPPRGGPPRGGPRRDDRGAPGRGERKPFRRDDRPRRDDRGDDRKPFRRDERRGPPRGGKGR